MKHVLLTVLVMTGFQWAHANVDHVQFGQMTSAGSGCTAQDALPNLEIENGKGSLTLSSLNIVADAKVPSLIAREACNVRLQATVERGYQLGIRVSDVSGTLVQARDVKTTVSATAGLVMKQEEQTVTMTYAAKAKGRYKIANKNSADAFSWTDCSGSGTLLALSVNANAVRSKASAAVNASVKALNFEVAVRACK